MIVVRKPRRQVFSRRGPHGRIGWPTNCRLTLYIKIQDKDSRVIISFLRARISVIE